MEFKINLSLQNANCHNFCPQIASAFVTIACRLAYGCENPLLQNYNFDFNSFLHLSADSSWTKLPVAKIFCGSNSFLAALNKS